MQSHAEALAQSAAVSLIFLGLWTKPIVDVQGLQGPRLAQVE
jgi:hypothetical protein